MRRRWANWRYAGWLLDRTLTLPRTIRPDQLRYEFVPLGMPWWKPSEEITGDLKAIGGGLDSPIRVVKERARGDIFDNIDDTIAVMKYAREQGLAELGEPLHLSFDPGPFPNVIETSAGA